VHGPEGVVEARVQRARIHVVREAHLLDAPQALKERMFDQVEQDAVGHADKPVYRVVEYLLGHGSKIRNNSHKTLHGH
jgi:hypothetical protein